MKLPQLTQAQCKFLLIKGLHLLAVLIIVAMLIVYFHKDNVPASTGLEPNQVEASSDISGFEQFCSNNQDINCGTIQSFLDEEPPAQIILMDTGEVDDTLREKIYNVAANGSALDLKAEDMNSMLDKLYEEDLPDDIIDEAVVVKNSKMINMKIMPPHKPPYFGKDPVVVIVIDDMGISLKRTADIASLKAPLTVSFLTYGHHLVEQVQNSRANGQEIMIHVPMEAQKAVDTAPDVLTTKMSKSEIKSNLQTMLAKFENIKGINNHMGSKLTEDKERMTAVMEVLKEQGLFFLDSKTSAASKAEEAAKESGVAYAHRHIFLDNVNDKKYILGQLKKTETLARKNGYAIAIGHPKTQTYAALKEWLPQADKAGLKLVYLSEVIKILNPAVPLKVM